MASSNDSSGQSQLAFQRAFRPELTKVVARTLCRGGPRVLDVPCGRGFYTDLMARTGPVARHLTAVDANAADVAALRQRLGRSLPARRFTVRTGDAYRLPFRDGSFDLIWCAESLISLEPVEALSEFRRLLTDAGTAVILEVDEYHHVLLPWPVELEAALPAALLRAGKDKYGSGTEQSPARTLRADLKAAGFARVRRRVLAFSRAAPFDAETTAFLTHHVEFLRTFAHPFLPKARQRQFDRCVDAARRGSLFRLENVELTLLSTLYTAGKGGRSAPTAKAGHTGRAKVS